MDRLSFNASSKPTLGVELELALVDAESFALRSVCPHIMERLPTFEAGSVKQELMQCYVEINTSICDTVAEAEGQLRTNLQKLTSVADEFGVKLLWSATHPFSSWLEQKVSPDERYRGLVNLLEDTARQLVTFGLHVHVGVDSGDKAVMICDRMLRHLPTLLAVSSNSPFWEGRATGLCSWRTKVMERLPTAGLPPFMRNWSEYVWLVNHLVQTGFIETIREIWWDVRPHHNFGTVEVRICDMPGNLHDATALVALIHCLVTQLSDSIDEGTYQHDCHPMLVRQNKWRAARFGLDAELVDSVTHKMVPVRDVLLNLVEILRPVAQQLQCTDELERICAIAQGPSWAQRQVDRFRSSKQYVDVARWMTEQSQI